MSDWTLAALTDASTRRTESLFRPSFFHIIDTGTKFYFFFFPVILRIVLMG